ncbi:MAG: PH domain-containing protein [Muribaculaceae bacterium]|nr:PH domain-containing protein [Muribaculaceae bacterium]
MNEKVVYSTYCRVMTISITLVLAAICIFVAANARWGEFSLILLILMAIIGFSMFYAPLRVTADEHGICIRRLLGKKFIPYSEITSVRMSPPTMGAYRACGSGGYCGYWGWYNEGDTGRYFAYYGKASDCFLVTLHNNRKYLIGCNNGAGMCYYINQHIV